MRYKKKILPNGVRILLVPMPESLTTTVSVLVEAGSEYETKDNNGISHFLEHMCFKGTKKRPSARIISEELDGIGAHYNAFTGQEYTGYWAKANWRKTNKIVDVVSDIYLNPLFDEGEIEKEKGVIVEEINMYEDIPSRDIYDVFGALLYGDQPAGWNVLGRKELIRKFKREDFLAYREKRYIAPATVIIVAGRFDEKKMLARLHHYFADLPSRKKEKKPKVIERQSRPQVAVKYKKTDQAHLMIGFRALDIFDKRNRALDLAAAILGGGMSSRLFQRLREEMGVAYYVRADNDASIDHGVFEIAAGVDVSRVRDAVRAILDECRALRDGHIDESELKKAKDMVIGTMYLGLESSDHWANYYGMQEVLKKEIISPNEFAKRIRAITPREISAIVRKVFNDKNLNMAVVGPFENRRTFSSLLKL